MPSYEVTQHGTPSNSRLEGLVISAPSTLNFCRLPYSLLSLQSIHHVEDKHLSSPFVNRCDIDTPDLQDFGSNFSCNVFR